MKVTMDVHTSESDRPVGSISVSRPGDEPRVTFEIEDIAAFDASVAELRGMQDGNTQAAYVAMHDNHAKARRNIQADVLALSLLDAIRAAHVAGKSFDAVPFIRELTGLPASPALRLEVLTDMLVRVDTTAFQTEATDTWHNLGDVAETHMLPALAGR